MLRRHGVTRGELKVLKQVSLLQHVSSPKHFLFVLNAIRQAGGCGEWPARSFPPVDKLVQVAFASAIDSMVGVGLMVWIAGGYTLRHHARRGRTGTLSG